VADGQNSPGIRPLHSPLCTSGKTTGSRVTVSALHARALSFPRRGALVPNLLHHVFKVILQATVLVDLVEAEVQPDLVHDVVRFPGRHAACFKTMNQLEKGIVVSPPAQRGQEFLLQVHGNLNSCFPSSTSVW